MGKTIEIKPGPASIGWFETDPGPCVVCGRQVGFGPVGYKADDPPGPVCDSCMLELNGDLGMMLVMVGVNRELASQVMPDDDLKEAEQRRVALMTFSIVYDEAARWPRRRKAVMTFLKGLVARMKRIPIDTLLKLEKGVSN